MSESTGIGTGSGRGIIVLAYGKTADELELHALDEAREFFGPDTQMEVVRSYSVMDSGNRPGMKMAAVTVREIAAGDQR